LSVDDAGRQFYGVSVVMPNWNGTNLLAANLPYVISVCNEYPGQSEIIVVDDASDDESVTLLREKFSDAVRTLQHEQNRGFGAACLTGVNAARHELVMFLNTDVRPLPGLLQPMARHFDDDDTFAVSPLVLSEDDRIESVSFRIPYLKRGRVHYRRWDWEKVLHQLPRPTITLWNSGGSALVSREKFMELGGFDPVFVPCYGEDEDLGVRAWRHGWRCYAEPAAAVVHPAGSSVISTRFSESDILTIRIRNSFFFDARHCTPYRFLCWWSLVRRSLQEVPRGRLTWRECANVFREVRRGSAAQNSSSHFRRESMSLKEVVAQFERTYRSLIRPRGGAEGARDVQENAVRKPESDTWRTRPGQGERD
jgi:GT2 family glycosyltransferase